MTERTRRKRSSKKPNGMVEHASGLTVRDAQLERARPFKWAWDQRVLMGYLNLQIGEEGVGKGNLTAWQAARISQGELTGDLMGKPRRVAFVGDEDAWDHIWVPRLHAAGADLTHLSYIASGPTGTLDVKNDVEAIADYIESEQIALMYFDQLLDNLGHADSWKDKDVRDALNPLRRVAQTTGCALLASMHPNKRTGSFRERISGTPAFNALSRSSLLVAAHPQEADRVVVVRAKGNYSIEPDAFEFRITEQVLEVERRIIKTSRITDIRETSLRRDDVLAGSDRRREDSATGQARQMLVGLFSDGEPRPAKQVLERMVAEGFAARTTQTARRDLGLQTWQDGFQGPWYWGSERPKRAKQRRRGARPGAGGAPLRPRSHQPTETAGAPHKAREVAR